MSPSQPIAYRYRETAIKTANPLQLVVIMYDGAIQALREAQEHLRKGNIAARARCTNRAGAILSELQATLNLDEGAEIAASLDRLYAYMKYRIFTATVEQNPEPLAEVVRLLDNLRSAWAELAHRARFAEAPSSAPTSPGVLPEGSASAVPVGSLRLCG